VALTPENQAMTLHLHFTLLAFRIFPVVTFLLTLAAIRSSVAPRRVIVAWAALTALLVGYVIVLGWGPRLGTTAGLMVQVVAQKVVAVTAVGMLVYLSWEADRIVAAARRSAR
jgi:hypothetical protein